MTKPYSVLQLPCLALHAVNAQMQYCFVQWKILDGMRRLVHYSQDNHPDPPLSQDKFLPAAHKLPARWGEFLKASRKASSAATKSFYVKMPCPNYNNIGAFIICSNCFFQIRYIFILYYHNVVSWQMPFLFQEACNTNGKKSNIAWYSFHHAGWFQCAFSDNHYSMLNFLPFSWMIFHKGSEEFRKSPVCQNPCEYPGVFWSLKRIPLFKPQFINKFSPSRASFAHKFAASEFSAFLKALLAVHPERYQFRDF